MKTGNCCPVCKSSWVRERKREHKEHKCWKCYACGIEFDKPEEREYKGYWSGKKNTKRKTDALEIINKRELLYIINKIDTGQNTARDHALITFTYLMGGRISEILGQKKEDKWRIQPIKKYQIEEKEIKDKKFWVIFHVGTLKRKKIIYRNIPIPIDKEKEFIDIIKEYISNLKENDYLFKLSRKRAWEIIKQNTGFFPHYFRHLRSSHLFEYHNFTEGDLMRFHGWSSSEPAKTYVHLNWQYLAERMG